MRNILMVTLFILFSSSCAAGVDSRAHEHASECLSVPNQKAELKSFILPINLNDPRGDAEARINHGDMRFLAIREIAIQVPGLPRGGDQFLCRYGIRIVDGITDVGGDEEYNQLVAKVKNYVAEYNRAVFEILSQK